MRVVSDSEQAWISWEEASRLTGIRVPTIEHATRVNRIKRRPARGIQPSLDRDSVLAWADWQREQVAQREARRRERQDATAGRRGLHDPLRPEDRLLGPPEKGMWLSLPAAAKRFDVGVGTVRRWVGEGRLDGVQRAQRWVTEESVERLIAERRADADM
ncbi:MAG: helix-turn-helix domain-containing protein [Nocardioides sp.]|uniref:helix-turn-helix domain-containing protein n=1 Tax=Nocardioides sp. TaxID=35761 RepID=UPI003263D1A6